MSQRHMLLAILDRESSKMKDGEFSLADIGAYYKESGYASENSARASVNAMVKDEYMSRRMTERGPMFKRTDKPIGTPSRGFVTVKPGARCRKEEAAPQAEPKSAEILITLQMGRRESVTVTLPEAREIYNQLRGIFGGAQ